MIPSSITDLEAGCCLIPEFVSDPRSLMAQCAGEFAWERSIPQRPFARFGVPYSDDASSEVIPFHSVLEILLDRIEARLSFRPNSCSVHWYLAGDSFMGFHSDNVADIAPGTGVAILSLGDTRTLRFQAKDNPNLTRDYLLAPGGVFFMSREIQGQWKHGVPRQAGVGARMSLVFRRIPL